MNKFTYLLRCVQYLFGDPTTAKKAKSSIEGILIAQSPRLSDISQAMPGKEEATYRCIQRFHMRHTPQEDLLRLYQESAPL